MSNQLIYIISAQLIKSTSKKFDQDEVKSVHWLSRKQINDLIKNKEIKDGVSLLALLFYFHQNKI